jgi:hypothetical protein
MMSRQFSGALQRRGDNLALPAASAAVHNMRKPDGAAVTALKYPSK